MMAASLQDLLPAIVNAGDVGITFGMLKTRFAGKSKASAKVREAQLRDALIALRQDEKVRGPVKHGRSQYYFASGRGPSTETAAAVVVREVCTSGTKLLSRAQLEKKVIGMNGQFFADAIKHAVASRAIVELGCGTSRYYLHRDVAMEYFGFEPTNPGEVGFSPSDRATASRSEPKLEELLPLYRRVKAEQGGLATVNISDLLRHGQIEKEVLHRLLLKEAKAGRLTIHPSTSVRLPPEVTDAAIRLAGFPEPFVTVVIEDEP
jgi:hypothetical protein